MILHMTLLPDCGSRLETLAVLAPADGSTLTHLIRVIEVISLTNQEVIEVISVTSQEESRGLHHP